MLGGGCCWGVVLLCHLNRFTVLVSFAYKRHTQQRKLNNPQTPPPNKVSLRVCWGCVALLFLYHLQTPVDTQQHTQQHT